MWIYILDYLSAFITKAALFVLPQGICRDGGRISFIYADFFSIVSNLSFGSS